MVIRELWLQVLDTRPKIHPVRPYPRTNPEPYELRTAKPACKSLWIRTLKNYALRPDLPKPTTTTTTNNCNCKQPKITIRAITYS